MQTSQSVLQDIAPNSRDQPRSRKHPTQQVELVVKSSGISICAARVATSGDLHELGGCETNT